MGTPFEYTAAPANQRVAHLQSKTVELERELSDARASLNRELAQAAGARKAARRRSAASARHHARDAARRRPGEAAPGRSGDGAGWVPGAPGRGEERGTADAFYGAPPYVPDDERPGFHDARADQEPSCPGGPGLSGHGAPTAVYERADYGDGPYDGAGYPRDGYPQAGYAVGGFAAQDFAGTGPADSDYDGGFYGQADYAAAGSAGPQQLFEERTEALVNQGRRGGRHGGLSWRLKALITGALAVGLITLVVIWLSPGGAVWPASVAAVQREVAAACQNPDVKAEPSQVNFACAKATRQILWVFALMTSADNPGFTDAKTGRIGLEPITPALGGEIAWSLNLHHPYDPANPIDSIEVAARAINNIIGGATLTGAHGNPVVQPGLEGKSAGCARYTGSPAIISRQGFPPLCARPVTSPGGQAALVADVYRKWIVGATSNAAHDAAVLFENAKNPGDPQVQNILKHLANSKLSA